MTRRLHKLRRLTLAIILAVSQNSLLADEQLSAHYSVHPLPHHAALTKSNQINFTSAFEQALAQAPEELLSQSARDQAEQLRAVANRWIVGAPSWQTSVVDDRLLSDLGMRELETGIEVNLWRPGERRDARNRGAAFEQRYAAWQNYLHWLVAGRLRSNLAELELADLQLAAARQAEQDALQLLETTRRLQNAGAASALDVLQAESLWLHQGQLTLDSEAALIDAERNWQILTGLSVRPADPHQESIALYNNGIHPEHPLLNLRQSEILINETGIAEAERHARGSPSVSLGVRRERGDWRQDYMESVGVSVSIPISSRAVIAAGTSEARAARTESELSRIQDLRELTTQLHEVRHEMFTLEQALPLTGRQRELNHQQWQMAQTAFSVGETDLTHVIMAMQRAQDSARDHQTRLLRQQHLNSEYNQIIGVLP